MGLDAVTVIRLRHIQRFTDRHGHTRHYLRIPGTKLVALPGQPGSPEFMTAYTAAVARAKPKLAPAETAGTLGAVAEAWLRSAAFRQLGKTTAVVYRRIVDGLRVDHGAKPIKFIEARHVRKLIADKAETPAAANHRLRVIRALCRQAIEDGVIHTDPTIGVKRLREAGQGATGWTEGDIAAYELRWPAGSRERLALALLLYTGQRRSDVVRMGWQHVGPDGLIVRQVKTGAELLLPLHPALAAELTHAPQGDSFFLMTARGVGMTSNGFYMRFKQWCRAAKLDRSPHGLRKAAARRLAEAGATSHEIAAVTGHKTLAEVQRYTRGVDQARLARAGIERVVKMG